MPALVASVIALALWFIAIQKSSESDPMLSHQYRIARVQRSLRWFEDDLALLNMRVKELSEERQESAKRFASAVIREARAELHKLLSEQPDDAHAPEKPCEPAD